MADICIRNATKRVNFNKRTIIQYKVIFYEIMQHHTASYIKIHTVILYEFCTVDIPLFSLSEHYIVYS